MHLSAPTNYTGRHLQHLPSRHLLLPLELPEGKKKTGKIFGANSGKRTASECCAFI
jgi:hypothetical protein